MSKNELSPKQERFCQEYIIDLNGTQAAIRAGYSPKTANEQSAQLLAKLSIKSRVDELNNGIKDKLIITAERVLAELARLATMDIAKAFDGEGNLLDIKDMPEDVRRAIASIEVAESEVDGRITTTKKIKFWDKNKSLETCARHLKMLTDKVEHSGKPTLEQIIAGSHALTESGTK